MSEIQKFEFEGNEVTFLTGENIMVNANEMAMRFNTKPNNWLRTDQASRLIDALSVSHKCDAEDLVRVVGGGKPEDQGTWMHQDVALIFAQWLSPEFYIWCNDRIKELFKYGVTALNEQTRIKIFKLSEVAKILQKEFPYKVGRYHIYEKLRRAGILNEHNIPYSEYLEKRYFEFDHYGKYVKYPVVTENGLNYIIRTLLPQAADNGRIIALEEKLNLALKGIEVIIENILISKSGSKTTEDQNKINVDKMRDICCIIKNISDEIPIDLTA